MKAKKHRQRRFDSSRPLPEWAPSVWVSILKNALKIQRRIARAAQDGNQRRVRYLQRLFNGALAPHALAQIAGNELKEWNDDCPAPSVTAAHRR